MSKQFQLVYTCKQCSEKDSPWLFDGESFPAALSCTQCGAGFGLKITEQLQTSKGMFPSKRHP